MMSAAANAPFSTSLLPSLRHVMCVTAGVGCVILPDHHVKNPASFVQALATHGVTHLTAVPTLLHALIPYLTPTPNPTPHNPRGNPRGKPCLELNSSEEIRNPPNAWLFNHNHLPVEPSDKREAAAFDSSSNRQRAVAFDTTSTRQRVAGDSPSERHRAVAGGTKLRLRLVMSSGEPLTLALAKALTPLLPPGCCLLNLYGSTEVAADCTCFDVSTHHSKSHDVPSKPGASLDAGFLTKSIAANLVTDVKAATSVPLAQNTQRALNAAQSAQQLTASALLPEAAWPAAQASGAPATAASMAAFGQDVVTASGRPGDHTETGPLSITPYPFQGPLIHNTKVAVGWPLDGFAVCILAMTTGLQEEKPPCKTPGKQAVHSSSSFNSTTEQQVSQHASLIDLSHAKKRKICLTGCVSETGPSESQECAETGTACHTGDELAGTVSIVEAGVVGEVAVAGTGLALGYHRYGCTLGLQILENLVVLSIMQVCLHMMYLSTKDASMHDMLHAMLCCAVLCCAVLCCAVLCCAVLCCAVQTAKYCTTSSGHPTLMPLTSALLSISAHA